jgi:hypothetical protein
MVRSGPDAVPYDSRVARVIPFRFGLGAVALRSRGQLRDLARKVEAGGWSTLLVS